MFKNPPVILCSGVEANLSFLSEYSGIKSSFSGRGKKSIFCFLMRKDFPQFIGGGGEPTYLLNEMYYKYLQG